MLDEVPCSQATVHEYAYDAEGKLISSAFGATRYIYDAEGNRVAKQNYLTGVITNQYLYDTAGRMTVEIDGSGNVLRQEIYAGNRYLGTLQNGTMYYSHANWLGTDSARSDSGGLLCQTSGSLPFGDALQVSGNCSPSPKFYTGKERDNESGLDYFGARYMSSNMGRFMSPDWSAKAEPVPYSKLDDPQTLNLYAYVGNNPLSRVDPDGHTPPPQYDPDGNQIIRNTGGFGPPHCICGPPPRNPDGSLKPPPTKLPDGKNGKPNRWVEKDPGKGTRGSKWGPEYPIANPGGGQPSASWDDRDGKAGKDHWDIDSGTGGPRDRRDENGNEVSPDDAHGRSPSGATPMSITPQQAGAAAKGVAWGVIIYWTVSEGTRLFPPRNLIPVP